MKNAFNFASRNDSAGCMMLRLCLLCLSLIWGGNISLQAEDK